MFGESEDERGAGISRRAFLTGACVTGAAAMVGGLNACAPPQDAGPGGAGGTGSGANGGAVPVSKAPSKVDKTYDADLLIVGAGGSGLACAVQAALNGTNLILVDKSNQVGGNANFVEGMFAVNSTLQLEQGIDMQPAEMYGSIL